MNSDSSIDDLWSPLPLMSSFQHGEVITAENPHQAAWYHLSEFGTLERAKWLFQEKMASEKKVAAFAAKIRQGIELRNSSRQASLLTSPLLLHYAFNDFSRALIDLYKKDTPKPSHGLKCRRLPTDNVLDTKVILQSKGTFPELVSVLNGNFTANSEIKLREILASIPEFTSNLIPEIKNINRVIAFKARFYPEGDSQSELGRLCVQIERAGQSVVEKPLSEVLPLIAREMTREKDGITYSLKRKTKNEEKIINRELKKFLIPDLHHYMDAPWYCLRADDAIVNLPRLAYYFLGTFILSNIVRYEPHLITNLHPTSSALGWTLQGFLNTADRYFPQLVLGVLRGEDVYFRTRGIL